jgi:hypothetical protein
MLHAVNLKAVGQKIVRIRKGRTNFRTPDFVDDFAVHILREGPPPL